MGAAGSVEQGLQDGSEAVDRIEDQLVDHGEAVKGAAGKAEEMRDDLSKNDYELLDQGISKIKDLVSDDQKEYVVKIMESARGVIEPEQITRAVKELKDILPVLEGAAVAAAIAGTITAVTDMAPEVVSGVSTAVLTLGEHLPFLGIAAGAIGAIAYAFKMSKDQDENVRVVSLWLSSVKDWIMLVAGKVDRSSAESTLSLYEGLQDSLLKLCNQIDSHERKWRITKMLGSSRFEQDFGRAKTAVLELKNGLRDYLDQETQDRQEEQLRNISSLQIETNEKLASMDDQLTLIREMLVKQEESRMTEQQQLTLVKQAEAETAAQNNTKAVRAEEEEIFTQILRSVGVPPDGPVIEPKFADFVNVFETFFFNGGDMPPEQRRGLNIAVDKDNTGTISKTEWVKFYRHWTASGLNVEEYLIKVAEDNPTLLQRGLKHASIAKLSLTEKATAAAKSRGIESVDDAKAAVAAKASELKSFGKNFFGSNTPPPVPSSLASEEEAVNS